MKSIRRCELGDVIREITEELKLFSVNSNRISVVVSLNGKGKALSRIYGLPREIQTAFSLGPLYTIEFVCDNILALTHEELASVLVHELLHIPNTFSGLLRPHDKRFASKNVKKMTLNLSSELKRELYLRVVNCCKEIL